MKPIFCRIGTKKTISNKIIQMIPSHKTYVEPFFGGGAVYFAKMQSEVEVINDIDELLIEGYRLLKNLNDDNISTILSLGESVNKIKNNEDRLELLNQIRDEKINNNDEGFKLYQILIVMCNTFNCVGRWKIVQPHSQINKLKKINEYKNRLKNTEIFSVDYKNIINDFDAPDTFFFLDPPYQNSKTGLYKHYAINYEELFDLLSNLKGKFLLTINSSDEIRRIFNNFNIEEINVKGLGNGLGKGTHMGRDRTELIITNY